MLDGEAWRVLIAWVRRSAELLLVAALAGVGLSTDFGSLRRLGLRPFLVGLAAAAAVGVISYLAITLAGTIPALR